ncbi:MAG TPA: Hpt domain-containing protein, partial [Bacteroidales bacterium]|nr:Hpt domain-containing protein [Bacteroidales bacterium]
CIQAGMNDYVSKPFEEEQLLRSIQSTMARFPDRKAVKSPPADQESGQESLPEQDEQPVYDLASLKETSAGDKTFFKEMVQLFITNTDQGLEEITEYLSQQEWSRAAEVVHRISSPCRHLKAEKLLRLLKEAEALLQEPDKYWMSAEVILEAVEEFELIRKDLESLDELK